MFPISIIKKIRQIIFLYLPRAEWIRKIPNKDLKVTKNSRVCINHFEETLHMNVNAQQYIM